MNIFNQNSLLINLNEILKNMHAIKLNVNFVKEFIGWYRQKRENRVYYLFKFNSYS